MRDMQAFGLAPQVVGPLRQVLPEIAGHAVDAIVAQVPTYAGALAGEMGKKIEQAVQAALGGFINLASGAQSADPGSPLKPALDGAYALGRGEARSGRSLDALLAAYRIGARVAWRELAAIMVDAGQQAITLARFAELVFAYIDELSAASVAGHADELAVSGRVRRAHLERLAQSLLAGDSPDVVLAAAQRADWPPPQTLTAVLLPERVAHPVVDLLDSRTLLVTEDGDTAVLLVPDAHGSARAHLLRLLAGRGAVVGPALPWLRVRGSFDRAVRTARLETPAVRADGAPVDTEDHLLPLVLTADAHALADLRDKALAPLAGERAATAGKLAETLRSWLLHQGRRDRVAAELFVHAQTVRYRMGRLRDLYGQRLDDPQWLLLLTVALALEGRSTSSDDGG